MWTRRSWYPIRERCCERRVPCRAVAQPAIRIWPQIDLHPAGLTPHRELVGQRQISKSKARSSSTEPNTASISVSWVCDTGACAAAPGSQGTLPAGVTASESSPETEINRSGHDSTSGTTKNSRALL